MLHTHLTFVWLILIALGTTWLLKALEQQTRVPTRIESAYVPDYAMVNFTSTATDENGLISYQLQANLLKHYPVINTELVEPYLVFYNNGHPMWYVRAEQARVSADGSTVYMPGKVWLWRYVKDTADWMQVFAHNMLVKPDDAYAESYAPVELHSASGITRSEGVKMFMQKQQVELLSKVKGHYEKR